MENFIRNRKNPLPQGVRVPHLFGVSLLAAMGFTMSLFIGSPAFEDQPQLLLHAKIGIVFASRPAGITGCLWLYFTADKSV